MMLIAPTEFVPFKGQPPMHITSADPICKWRVDHPDGTTFTHFTLVPTSANSTPVLPTRSQDNIGHAVTAPPAAASRPAGSRLIPCGPPI